MAKTPVIPVLLVRHLRNELSDEEQHLLNEWLDESSLNRRLFNELTDQQVLSNQLKQFNAIDTKPTEEKIKRLLGRDQKTAGQNIAAQPVHRVHFLKWAWFRYAAAIILLAGLSVYLYYFTPSTPEQANNISSQVMAPQAVLATITLSDGKTVPLDSLSKGLLIEGNAQIEKTNDGEIIYKGVAKGEVLYNTISVPRGSKIVNLTLADGTKVFLNTASSLRYPVVFAGKERRVQVSGEAYFEVTKDHNKRFIVESENITTEVLGTHFNVHAYNDENVKAITLLEGSIKVNQGTQSVIVKPGEQAVLNNDNIRVAQSIDTNIVLAWKNGYFIFENAGIKTVMTQISKWYDIEVIYENKVPDILFSGRLQRKLSLNQVVSAFSKMGVHCTIKGRKLIISSKP